MLDSSDAMHIVKMDLANLIMKSPSENREVRYCYNVFASEKHLRMSQIIVCDIMNIVMPYKYLYRNLTYV